MISTLIGKGKIINNKASYVVREELQLRCGNKE